MLDIETLRTIAEAGGEFQISLWPRRAKSGAMYLRLHIEPPYEGSEDAELDEEEFEGAAEQSAEDDIPF